MQKRLHSSIAFDSAEQMDDHVQDYDALRQHAGANEFIGTKKVKVDHHNSKNGTFVSIMKRFKRAINKNISSINTKKVALPLATDSLKNDDPCLLTNWKSTMPRPAVKKTTNESSKSNLIKLLSTEKLPSQCINELKDRFNSLSLFSQSNIFQAYEDRKETSMTLNSTAKTPSHPNRTAVKRKRSQDSTSERSSAPATHSANKFLALDKSEDSVLDLKPFIKNRNRNTKFTSRTVKYPIPFTSKHKVSTLPTILEEDEIGVNLSMKLLREAMKVEHTPSICPEQFECKNLYPNHLTTVYQNSQKNTKEKLSIDEEKNNAFNICYHRVRVCQTSHSQTSMTEIKEATLDHLDSTQSDQDAKVDKISILRKAPMLGTRILRRSIQEKTKTPTTAMVRKAPVLGRSMYDSVQEKTKTEKHIRKVPVLGRRVLEIPKQDTKTVKHTINRTAPVLGTKDLERPVFGQTRSYNVSVTRKAPMLGTRALKLTMNRSIHHTYTPTRAMVEQKS